MLKRAALLAGPLLLAAGYAAGAGAASQCDRSCLEGFVTQYLSALVKRDPGTLPLAPNVRFTENSVELKIGEGLWKTASALRTYRQDVLDARIGVAGSHVVLEENGAPVMFVLRLRIADRKIAEVETMTVRNEKEGAIFDVAELKTASAAMTLRPPSAQLPSRNDAIRIADYYPAGLRAGSFVTIDAPFTATAYRFENGHLMAGPGCTFREQCENIKTQPSPTRPSLTSRLVAVDEEMGVVWYRLAWDRPRDPSGDLQMVVWEAFKIYDGKIQAVEAFMKLAPKSLGSGWEQRE